MNMREVIDSDHRAVIGELTHDEKITRYNRVQKMIRDEPAWALGRVLAAEKLENDVERLRGVVKLLRGELLIVASASVVPLGTWDEVLGVLAEATALEAGDG